MIKRKIKDIIKMIKTAIQYFLKKTLSPIIRPKLFLWRAKQNVLKRKPLSKELEEFIRINGSKWAEFVTSRQEKESNSYILVDLIVSFPVCLSSHCIVGTFFGVEEKLTPLALLRQCYNREVKAIANSYQIKHFVCLSFMKLNWWLKIKSFFDALKIYKDLKSGHQLLNTKYKGILIGDLMYDDYLRTYRWGTISEINLELFETLYDAIFSRNIFERLFKKYPIKGVIVGGIVYNTLGILARIALEKNIPVYIISISGSSQRITVTKYKKIEESKTYAMRPTQGLVNLVENQYRELALQKAEQYLSARINFKSNNFGTGDAYDSRKLRLNKEEFIERFKLNPNYPIVCIMSHVFIDASHSNNWAIFDDYLIWLRETLKFASGIESVNWIVKPHPEARHYDEKNSVEAELEEIKKNPRNDHIKLCPNYINSVSLYDIVDVVVTASGTAGLEYSCFGIPSIVAGETPYSGYGFTFEPKTKEEYFKKLKNIRNIKRLSKEQIEKAKVLAFIYFMLLKPNIHLIPRMPIIGAFDKKKVWDEAKELIEKNDVANLSFYKKFSKFLNSNKSHLIDYDLLEGKEFK